MNVARFIAKRYSKSKKKRNVINLITGISVVGITISTAALVILLSAFNGIEQMVVQLYSDFDPPLTIQSAKAKTFNQHFLPIEKIKALEGVNSISRSIEEVVILRKKDKWVHAKMLGVDSTFLPMAKVDEHIIDGEPLLYDHGEPQAIFGASLLNKLEGYIPFGTDVKEQIVFNAPLREAKLRPGKKPLNTRRVEVSSRVNYNREVNAESVVVPYELAEELLEYGDDITSFFIDINRPKKLTSIQKSIQEVVGEDFVVKTNLEKNELIFKTSKSERLIVYFILVFIFILASFNLIASITMLFLEKKEDINTLFSLGANKQLIFNIFFFEGLMIVAKGAIIGLFIGYGVTFGQLLFGWIEMPNTAGADFPMYPTVKDAFLILFSVSILGVFVSYFPMKVLLKRHQKFTH